MAAPTTSLPETPGGARNWDYRFSWVRDACLTMDALWMAACPDEAAKFFAFLSTAAATSLHRGADLQIMFGVGGERDQVFAGRFHQAAEFAPELDTPERIAGPPFNTTITKLPAGLVTIIYPFNWPLAILAASLPYALMAGNTVIVKPPPTAPLSSVRTLRHLVWALPPGVLNVVTGADEILGPAVVGDPRIRHVCFTGSVGGGRRIMTMAAANLTNVTLELGGNDPAIILDDADMDQAAFGRLSSATFMTTGQVCMAVKRLYVPRRRYDEVIDGLRATLQPTRAGPGLDPDTTMGPLNTQRQRDYVAGLCEEARRAGTEVLTFGEYTSGVKGNYLLPALVLDPAPQPGPALRALR